MRRRPQRTPEGHSQRASKVRADRSGSVFALRLVLSFAATLILVGVVGYVFMDHRLHAAQVERFAEAQRSYATTFERYGASSQSSTEAIRRINRVLDALGDQDGALETLLIDDTGIVRASADVDVVGTRDVDSRISAALKRGESYAGQEADPDMSGADFEFVTPVRIGSRTYALELSYDHHVLDRQLVDTQRGLLLVGLMTLLLGSAVFYLFGGRALLRSHYSALQRATRDGLTDLPNQRAFQDEFPRAIAAAERNHAPLALMALDVDDFKLLNDRHGHLHGDAILRRLATVLADGRPGDRAYRVGGDEFAVILPQTDGEGVRVLAKRLKRALRDARIDATIGLSASRPGHPGGILRAEADAALYEAKRLGGNQIAHFDDIREHVTVIGNEVRDAVRRMIHDQGISTVYQPIWNISEGTLMGIEALSRPAAEYGLSGPAEAFDVAEQIGLVHELDEICVRTALQAAGDLPEGALLFLNLCPRTLDLDAEGNDWLRVAVEDTGLPPSRVVIEVTERFGGRGPSILKCLQRLHGHGFKIAIDDVGTGNSGLSVLRHVEVEFVKLDQTIVNAAATESGSRAILMAVAAYARQTGAFVIAEGIENGETLEFLQNIDEHVPIGHDTIQGGQGFGLGRPEKEIAPSSAMPTADDFPLAA